MSTIDSLIAQNMSLREQNTALERQIKAHKEIIDINKAEILKLMDEQGVSMMANSTATVSISENVRPNITDWDAVYEYVRENDRFDLLYRRMTAAPYAELINAGVVIPGTEPITIRDLNMRKKSA